MSELSMTSRDAGAFTLVEADGDIDLISAPVLRASFERLFRDERIHLVMDLSRVPFIDSTGLGVLVGALRTVKRHGGDIRVVCANPRVLRVFTITGLDQVFTVFDTPDEALAARDGEAGAPTR
ncbi:MAG: STAS domain-containing protein [Mobilicoccus sp.]|nr:STAS domain-containing protein [Mobilicoccus sp.]